MLCVTRKCSNEIQRPTRNFFCRSFPQPTPRYKGGIAANMSGNSVLLTYKSFIRKIHVATSRTIQPHWQFFPQKLLHGFKHGQPVCPRLGGHVATTIAS